MTEREVFEKLEEILASYGARQMDLLTSHKEVSVEMLFEYRGKAKACKEIAGALRNSLGYSPEEFQ